MVNHKLKNAVDKLMKCFSNISDNLLVHEHSLLYMVNDGVRQLNSDSG